MEMAEAIEPFDHQGQEQEESIHQHAVGVVMLNVLDTIKILGVIESLVLDFPAALGQFEARPRRQPGSGEVGDPFGLNDRSILLVLPIAHDAGSGPIQRFPGIEVGSVPDFDAILAEEERVGWWLLAESGIGRRQFRQVLFEPGNDGKTLPDRSSGEREWWRISPRPPHRWQSGGRDGPPLAAVSVVPRRIRCRRMRRVPRRTAA